MKTDSSSVNTNIKNNQHQTASRWRSSCQVSERDNFKQWPDNRWPGSTKTPVRTQKFERE